KGDGTFADKTGALGLEAIARNDSACPPQPLNLDCLLVGWGAAFQDFDHDGRRDLVLLQSEVLTHVVDKRQPAAVWRGMSAGFEAIQTELRRTTGRSLIAADLDGDGALDLVMTQWGGPVQIWKNVAAK